MNKISKDLFDDVFGKDFEKFQEGFDGFVDDIYKNVEVPSFVLSKGNYPKVNIKDKDNSFEITAATPGLEKEEIEVKFVDGLLVIKGKSSKKDKNNDDKFIMRELKKSSFMRSFKVDTKKIDINKIKCSYANGELTVTIPKKEENNGDSSVNFDIS